MSVDAVRRFSRFYTRKLGVLERTFLGSGLALPEARLVFELATQGPTAPGVLADQLAIDPGYVSRLVAALVRRGVVSRHPDPRDRRAAVVALTAKGKRAFAALDAAADEQARELLASAADAAGVVSAMAAIERAFEPAAPRAVVYRDPEPGDLGWIVQRHGAIYAAEYGWNPRFEALVARVVSDSVEHRTRDDRTWIVEVDGRLAGCVLCVRQSKTIAKLRILLVEPWARGLGIGRRLVDEVILHARRRGFRKLRLWTNSVLVSARRIYEAAGFTLVEEEPNDAFGPKLVAQTWELVL